MAYNPFDDVIENDPAYMANGGPLPRPKIGIEFPNAPQTFQPQRSVIPQQRVDPTDQEIFRPFATAIARGYKLLTPEQETLDQIEKDQQLRSLATTQAFQGTEFDQYAGDFDLPSSVLQNSKAIDLLDQAGFKRESFTEGFSRVGQFLYGNQRKAFDKLKSGEQLNSEDRLSIALAPLDSLDFLLPPVAIKKLAGIGLKNINAVLKSTSDLPEVQQVKQLFGGSPVPLIQDAAKGPPGMVTEPRIALSPADEGAGATKIDARKSKENIEKIKQTKIKKEQEELFEPYRKDFGDYLSQTKVPSAKGFYEYLTKNNIPLTLEKLNVPGKKVRYKKPSEKKDPNKNIFTETEHLKKAVNYLTDNQSPLGPYREEWTKVAEEILENSNTPLANSQILEKLRQQGIEIEGNAIQKINEFIKKPYLSNEAKKNTLKGRPALETQNRIALKQDLDAFVQDLKNNPDKQNLGIENYTITRTGARTGDTRLKVVLGDYRGGREGVSKPGRRTEKGGDIITPEFVEEIRELTKIKQEPRDLGFRQYVPTPTKVADTTVEGIAGKAALPRAQQKLNDLYRTNFVLNDPKTGENIYDFTNLENFEKTASAYGINRVPTGDPNASMLHKQNHEQIMKLAKDIEILQKGYLSPAQRQGYIDVINESRQLTEYTKPKFKEIIMANPDLRDQLVKEYTEYYTKFPKTVERGGKKIKIPVDEMTLDDFIDAGSKAFEGHVSHLFRIDDFVTNKAGMMGMGDVSNLVRTNMGNENIAFQRRAENTIDNAVADIRKTLNKNKIPFKGIRALARFNNLFQRKGMGAYRRLDKKNLTREVINFINGQFGKKVSGTIAKREGDDPEVFKKFNDIFIGSDKPLTLNQQKARFDQLMDYYVKNPKSLKVNKGEKPKRKKVVIEGYEETPYIARGFIDTMLAEIIDNTNFKKGGAVRMAIGGDPLQNINQQQFTPDPAFEGEDFFQQAVDSGNLTAFNPTKLFKVFGKVDAVETPKKKIETDAPQGPPGTTLPATQQMQPSDFAFKSFTLDVINDPNAPKAARPQDWMNFFKGKAAPEAELRDTGLMQFLEDYAKYYPDQKLTQQRLTDFYEQSPMGNISIKVKQEGTAVPADPDYLNFVGRPRHKNTGNQDLDNVGTNYREVVVQSGPLPGETKPFVESGHFQEQNVIGFTRVADYKNVDGQNVAVIQELQTDMLTKVRKEQERIAALLKRIEKIKERAEQRIASGDAYESESGQNMLRSINNQFPTATLQKLQENLSAIKPFPNTAGLDQVPKFAEQLQSLQKQINDLVNVEIKSPNPQTPFALEQLENQQSIVLNNLLDLTRNTEMERELQGLKVPSSRETDDLQEFAGGSDTFNVNYGGFKDLELFPPVPFNKQPDYVDLLVKATIKDAQSKGINKVAIMPAEKVNMRWGKDPDGPAGVKFKNLYDKVVPQQLKNIAKKYGGTLQVEQIVDPNKPSKGLRFFNRDVDGGLKLNKEDVARRTDTESEEGINEFYNEQIRRFVSGGGYRDKDVVLTREVAPGQFQDFFVRADDDSVNFVPLGEGDIINDALIVIEEFNPQAVDMVTLTLDSPKSKEPFFMFKKKDGGTIAKDSLVSVTDIFGEYGSR